MLATHRKEQNALSYVQERAALMFSRLGFLGVPAETFEQAGREQLVALLQAGLNPESNMLEFGCGCLRIAYWLIRFLDPGCYHGIEPARSRIEHGLEYLFPADVVRAKCPRFDYNADFNSSVFATRFDFFLARSISGPSSPAAIRRSTVCPVLRRQ